MSDTHPKTSPTGREPALRSIAMPADTNSNGDIFGGWLLSQMDLAGGSLARQRAQGRIATVAITGMTFHMPVFVGDEVTCYADITRVGRSSIAVQIESWERLTLDNERTQRTEGT